MNIRPLAMRLGRALLAAALEEALQAVRPEPVKAAPRSSGPRFMPSEQAPSRATRKPFVPKTRDQQESEVFRLLRKQNG